MIIIALTGHGLIYPDSSGSANVWEHIQNLATSTETALDAYENLTTWNPTTWETTSGGGFTSVGGSGFAQGFYMRIGQLIHAEFRIELASGFAVNTGTYALQLPLAAYVGWGGAKFQSSLGTWTARDDSGPYHHAGAIGLWDSAGVYCSFNGAWDGTAPRSRIDSNDPIPWASGDILAGVLRYRAA